jgi:hypothetical protein
MTGSAGSRAERGTTGTAGDHRATVGQSAGTFGPARPRVRGLYMSQGTPEGAEVGHGMAADPQGATGR